MNWFFVIALLAVSILFSFLGFRLTGIGNFSWIIAGIMLGLILFYPLIWYDIIPTPFDKLIRALVHFDMGMLSLLVTFLLLREIIGIPLLLVKSLSANLIYCGGATITIFLMSLPLLIYGYIHAANGPKILTLELPFKNLHEDLNGYRILQISDLHAGPAVNERYVQHVVDMAIKEQPDLVVLTGDIGDGQYEKYAKNLKPMEDLTSRFNTLYITGNHEYIKDSNQWIAHMKRIGAKVLLNEHVTIQEGAAVLLFAGVIDPEAKNVDPKSGPDTDLALKGSKVSDLRILLAHQPNIAEKASQQSFDLQLSGHTHSGQFFPWTLLIKVFQSFDYGLKKCGNMWVYTNPGTGFWGPPLRIGSTSEITVFELCGTSM